ncbi:aminopeptidase, partial [Pseudomonas sp. BAgro211]|nr:aminopeptidase [Pseudomonas sp. BAgro211]
KRFTELVLDTRERLQALYASPRSEAEKSAGKQAEFERLSRDYARMRDEDWVGKAPLDAWVNAPLNIAKLLPFGLYAQWVPAFAAM